MNRISTAIITSAVAVTLWAGAASAQTINWIYANGYAANHPNTGVLAEEFIRQIDEATEGRLKIRHVGGGTLLKPENMLEGLGSDVAQMGTVISFFFPGHMPIASELGGITDPRLGNQLDAVAIMEITRKLIEETPEFSQEFEKLGLKPLLWVSPPPYAILSTQPVASVSDLKGIKARSFGAIDTLLKAVGAAPLSMAYGEVYTSLQTGVIDAAVSDLNGIVPGKWYEVAKNVLTTGPEAGALNAIAPIIYIVNLEAWNSLPPDVQEAVEGVATSFPTKAAEMVATAQQESEQTLIDAGVKIRHLSMEEAEAWAQEAPDLYQAAAEKLNAVGLPGNEIIQRYKDMAASYVKASPKE